MFYKYMCAAPITYHLFVSTCMHALMRVVDDDDSNKPRVPIAERPTALFRMKHMLFAQKKGHLRGAAFHRLLEELMPTQPALVVWWRMTAIAALVYMASERIGGGTWADVEVFACICCRRRRRWSFKLSFPIHPYMYIVGIKLSLRKAIGYFFLIEQMERVLYLAKQKKVNHLINGSW